MAHRRSYGVGQYVASEAHQTLIPRSWCSGQTRGVVVAGGYSSNALTLGSSSAIGPPLASRLPALAADMAGSTGFGNDTAQTRVGQAWTYFKSGFGVKTDKALLVGISQGAPAVLGWAVANASTVAAIALVIPVTDLADMHDNNRGGYAAAIETAYGGSAAYTAALPTHNPIQSYAGLAGIPIKLWYSTDDTTVVPATATAYATATGATAVSMGAVGHGGTAQAGIELGEFLAGYA